MQALDGNAIAGALFEHYGVEMTSEFGTCGYCGATAQLAELRVYVCAPGTIGRCPACGNVVMAVVTIREIQRVDDSRFALVRTPGAAR